MKRLYLIFIVLFSANAFAYITQDIVGGCDTSKIFVQVFQINSYTCDSGYFLPADTLGCQPCPSGHTCSGGTFNYNPTVAQGITFTRPTNANVTKGCSANFGTIMVPVFQANTVNVTWDDGNGNTTTGTCTYDGELTLPAEPAARPGYTFSGWRVKTTSNE